MYHYCVILVHGLSVLLKKGTDNGQRTTDNCTGEAFGELFLAMTDNLSSKCFAPTDNEQLTTDNSIQKYVFVACKVVKYQIVTFYENRLKGEQYAKNPGWHLP